MERGWGRAHLTWAVLSTGLLLAVANFPSGPARADTNTLYLCSAWEAVSPTFLEETLSEYIDPELMPIQVLGFDPASLRNDEQELHILLLNEDVLDSPPACLTQDGVIPDIIFAELQDATERFSRPPFEGLRVPNLPQSPSNFALFNRILRDDRVLIYLSRHSDDLTQVNLQVSMRIGGAVILIIERQMRGETQ